MQKKKVFLFTQEGLDDMKKELADLHEKRKPAVAELSRARDMGDRSENAAYKSARQILSGLDRRTQRLEQVIKYSQVVQPRFKDIVDIGSRVILENENGTVEYLIVGGMESDLSKARLSCFSPVGKAVMNKKVGERVSIHVPAGRIEYLIKEIK